MTSIGVDMIYRDKISSETNLTFPFCFDLKRCNYRYMYIIINWNTGFY